MYIVVLVSNGIGNCGPWIIKYTWTRVIGSSDVIQPRDIWAMSLFVLRASAYLQAMQTMAWRRCVDFMLDFWQK